MRIFIDLGHPAHVHYFRNFIKQMESNGHLFKVSARRRSIIHYLLEHYNISYFDRGKGNNTFIGKFIYMFIADMKLFFKALRFKPDLFLSFASPYAAQTAWLLRKPHVVLDDTEHAKFGHAFYKPFSRVLLNPFCFYKDFGKKQLFFNSFTELFYLHPNYYKPDPSIYDILKIKRDEKYVLLRFVSWEASHDLGQSGLNRETRQQLISFLSKKYKVFVSMEGEKDKKLFSDYLVDIPPERMHDLLNFADLFISESGTMASESAILGIPVVYINSLPLMGYLKEHKNNNMLYHFSNSVGVFDKVKDLVELSNTNQKHTERKNEIVNSKINPTKFLIWFIENFPQSAETMRTHPEYQNRFK